jgi:hypothetical protein
MKHLDLCFYWLREAVEEGMIDPIYVPTEQQLADILTKAVTKKVVEYASLLDLVPPPSSFGVGGLGGLQARECLAIRLR